jgi:hypothetical protein
VSGVYRTTFEPFRVHSIEPLRTTTPEHRTGVIGST